MIEWSAWKSCWRTEWCSTMQFIIHEGNSTVKGLSRTHGLHHRSSRILICGVPARNITVTVFFLRIYFCRQIAYDPLRSHVRSLHREDAAIQVDVSYPIEVTCEKHPSGRRCDTGGRVLPDWGHMWEASIGMTLQYRWMCLTRLRSHVRSLHQEDAAIQVDVSYQIEVTCEKHPSGRCCDTGGRVLPDWGWWPRKSEPSK